MFAEFDGLPLHILINHAAVVFGPLAALCGLSFIVPKWRYRLRWPLIVLSGIAVVSVFFARESGERLKVAIDQQLDGTAAGILVARHEDLAERLWIAVLVLGLLSVIALFVSSRRITGFFGHALAVLLACAAVAVIVFTVQTGEVGARAVWNPAGTVDYSP